MPSFHPLVVDVANKYNLSRDDAKSIIDETRRNNPSLIDDDITLSLLENSKEFQNSLKAYRDKYIDIKNILEPFKEKENKKNKKEINDAFSRNLSQDEIDDILSSKAEMESSIRTSKLSSEQISKVFYAFKDPRRMDFVGHYIQRRVSEIITNLQTDAKYANDWGIKQHNTRAEYYDDADVREVIRQIIVDNDFANCIEDLIDSGKEDLAKELEAASENYFTLLYMYGSDLFREEGVTIGPDGIMSSTKISSTSEDRNDSDNNDAEEDEDDIENEEKPVGDFSVSDQNKSVYSKIVPDIKVLLSNCLDSDANGVIYDKFGYGLPTYMSISEATNRLHIICDGCKSSSEVMDRLRAKMENEQWIATLYNALDTNTDIGTSEDIHITQSRKEQLQTMFFQSVVKPFTQFKQTFKTFLNGEMLFATSDGNLKNKYDSMMTSLIGKFKRMAGAEIFRNGALDDASLAAIKQRIAAPRNINIESGSSLEEQTYRTRALMNQLKDSYTSPSTFKPVTDGLGSVVKSLVQELKNIGINLSQRDINRYIQSGDYDISTTYRDTQINKFESRISKIISLINSAEGVINSLQNWCNYSEENALSNPFTQKRLGDELSELANQIRRKYGALITMIAEASPDSRETSAHMGGKDFYSRNNPSSIGTMIQDLQQEDTEKLQDYIRNRYGQDTVWYVKDKSDTGEKSTAQKPHFYSDWLEDIYYSGGRKVIAYAEKPLTNGKSYDELSDIEYALSILNDYFGTTGTESELAWYRMLIASDKPRYSMVRGKKYTNRTDSEEGYKSIISRKAANFFAQEIKRAENVMSFAAFGTGTRVLGYDPNIDTEEKANVIEKMRNGEAVTLDDVVKNGKYIFAKTGAAFYMNKFVNNEIENGTPLGFMVVDKIFNSHLNKEKELLTGEEIRMFKEMFRVNMDIITNRFYDTLKEAGLFEYQERKTINDDGSQSSEYHAKHIIGSMQKWHENDQNYMSLLYVDSMRDAAEFAISEGEPEDGLTPGVLFYYSELLNFKDDLNEFVYNNWLAKANMSQLFDVDLAFYKDTPNFQKRNAQVVSSGYIADPDAKIHGQFVSDGKYRSITIKTPNVKSSVVENINTIFNFGIEKETDQKLKAQLIEARDNTIKTLKGKGDKGFDATDGQALTGLTALRKRLAGQGGWSRSNSENTDEIGYTIDEDGNKNYVYTDEAVYRRIKRGNPTEIRTGDLLHVFGEPQKPFVYAAINMPRNTRGTITIPVQHKNSEYLLSYINAFSATIAPKSQAEAIARFLEETAEDDIRKGVDTVNFDSGVKIGNNSDMIDITGLNGEETLKKLRSSIYKTDGKGNYIKDSNGRKIRRDDTPGAVTEYNVSDYKIVQQKPEHFKHNAQPLGTQMKILAINNIKDDAECTLPNGTKISGKELKKKYFEALNKKIASTENQFRKRLGLNLPHSGRIHRLSNTLKEAMATDQKFDAEMRKALSIVNRDGVDQFELPLDDPAVQGAVESMLLSKIRRTYYKGKTNGGVVVQATSWGEAEDLNIRFYSSNPADKDGLIPANATQEYKDKYQTGFAYFECEMPMPDYIRDILSKQKGGLRTFLNTDGTWKMDKIKEVLPESAFDCICYRIPTEAKYSIMLGKIVRFAPSWSGSVGKFPKELTIFTGSDFDIDTDFVELRPIEGSDDYDIDKQIFDLQVAALRSESGVLETFRPGDFSDLQDLSYYITCLRNGMTQEELSKMSSKEIKDACDRFEDMDLLDPTSDILLRKQNADAKNMIGIAAVGVTSHAFVSLYNDSHLDDPDNCVRVAIKNTRENGNEAFSVINDKDGENVTFEISGNIILDPTHDMDGKLIGTEISKYVGGSADAAKDAALYRLNIVENTLPILIVMHRLGISSDVARLFISQPVIRDIVRKMNSATAFDYSGFDDIIKDVIEDLEQDINKTLPEDRQRDLVAEYNSIEKEGNVTLRYSDLLKTQENPKSQSVGDKLKQIHVFRTLHRIQKQVSNLDSFTRYNSANAMKGSNYLERLVARQKIKRLEINLNTENPRIILPKNIGRTDDAPIGEYGKLFSMFPYIGRTISGEEEMDNLIFQEEMQTYGIGFFDAARRLQLIDSPDQVEDEKKLRTLYNGWKSYLMFVGDNRIADFNDENVAKSYMREFDKYWNDTLNAIEDNHKDIYDDVIENNSFISSIGIQHAKDGYGDFSFLSSDITRVTGVDREKFKRDWEALLKYPETRDLAIKTAIHFLARNAGFARDTPVVAMPLAIKEAIPNYTRVFTDANNVSMSDESFEHFLNLFLRNNADKDKGIVPHIYNNKKGDKYIYDVENDPTKFYINVKRVPTRLAPYINKDKDKGVLEISMPILCLEDEFLLEVTDPEIQTIKLGNDSYYAINVMPTTPLGIPNQMAEYGGEYVYTTGTLMVDPGENIPSADNASESGSMTAKIDDGYEGTSFILGEINEDYPFRLEDLYLDDRRSGSYFSSEPFGDNTHNDNINILAEDPKDFNTGYLESRQYLQRAKKISSVLGFDMKFTQRGVSTTGPTYALSLVPKTRGMEDQHESAIKAAALVSSLGFEKNNPVVKTYVSDARDGFNAVELAIPITKYESVIKTNADKLGYAWEYNDDRKELQFVIELNTLDEDKKRKLISAGINRISQLQQLLVGTGVATSGKMTASLIKYNYLSEDIIKDELNIIKNETDTKRPEDGGQNTENLTGFRESQSGQQVRLSDLAELALRRKAGEKINSELRELFMEGSPLLKDPVLSRRSSELVESAWDRLDDNAYSSIVDALDAEGKADFVTPILDTMFIRIANWILTNGSNEEIIKAITDVGVPQQSAESILTEIKNIIEELDIC